MQVETAKGHTLVAIWTCIAYIFAWLYGACSNVVVPVQHPDLIEKRRKVFADRIRHHLAADDPEDTLPTLLPGQTAVHANHAMNGQA